MTLDDLTLQTPYLDLDDEFYDVTDPEPLDDPYLISFNSDAAALIGLDNSAAEDPGSSKCSTALSSPKAPGPSPCAMPATSSAILSRALETGVPSTWGKSMAGTCR